MEARCGWLVDFWLASVGLPPFHVHGAAAQAAACAVRDATNPCLTCGACCAAFRVSFYWSEAESEVGGEVPIELTERVSPTLLAMQGTHRRPPRCVALEGEVGRQVSCGIYARRPSTCRDFVAGSSACQQARRVHGLPELPAAPNWHDAITSQVIATFTP